MLPQFLALGASLSFGFLIVFVQLGLNAGGTPLASTILNLVVNTLFLWVFLIAWGDLGQVLNSGVWVFLLIGVFVPGLARYSYFHGAQRIGASRSATLKSLSPLFSVLIAIVAFGERLTLPIAAGTGLIVTGILLVASKRDAQETWPKVYLTFPLLTALLFALRDNLARFGFNLVASPLVGAAMAATGGFVSLLLISRLQGSAGQLRLLHRSSLYFAASGVFGGIAYICLFTALSSGRVVTVAPLLYADPLLVPVISYFLLRGSEALSWRLGLGAVAVVSGIAFIFNARL